MNYNSWNLEEKSLYLLTVYKCSSSLLFLFSFLFGFFSLFPWCWSAGSWTRTGDCLSRSPFVTCLFVSSVFHGINKNKAQDCICVERHRVQAKSLLTTNNPSHWCWYKRWKMEAVLGHCGLSFLNISCPSVPCTVSPTMLCWCEVSIRPSTYTIWVSVPAGWFRVLNYYFFFSNPNFILPWMFLIYSLFNILLED